ncbi:MAG: thioesterase family protein, partial [Bryobacteraceae bacterium]
VGTQVNVAHLAATPMGMNVTFRSEVTAVEGRRVSFKVEAFDEREKIAEGTHDRAIINIAKFASRVQLKAAQA